MKPDVRRGYGAAVVAASLVLVPITRAAEIGFLEKPLCWGWVERVTFRALVQGAEDNGRPEKKVAGVFFEDQSLDTPDGRTLYGYRASRAGSTPATLPAVLVVPGNAMLADQLFADAAYFALHGMVAYVFDYRGYGGSTGEPYSGAFLADHQHIVSRLSEVGHPFLGVYAISFGGVIALASLENAPEPEALVLDGVISELPFYAFGCPNSLDPVKSIKRAPRRTAVLSGSEDPVVRPKEASALNDEARRLGLNVRVLEGFSHPGLDRGPQRLERLKIVRDFLTKGE